MTPRSRELDRALPGRSPGLWILTILILVVGAVLVVLLRDRPERDREDRMAQVRVGDPGSKAVDAIGSAPLRCPVDGLDYLDASFPGGWAASAVDLATERLDEVTRSRWVFGIGGRIVNTCGSNERRTEVGIDSAGNIVWFVPVLGRSVLQLPAWLEPTAATEPTDSSPR